MESGKWSFSKFIRQSAWMVVNVLCSADIREQSRKKNTDKTNIQVGEIGAEERVAKEYARSEWSFFCVFRLFF